MPNGSFFNVFIIFASRVAPGSVELDYSWISEICDLLI